ncbi:MAG: translation initiation factor IF-3 [Candidatus Uhrbacteria bacterium]|nr:translation initiation factor IF-3 [Candidatus Uhrbacteria bacterium]MDP3793275.1 translation initiation factor IF-3 [Candidatus Uhrbacteria bacterium]
MRIHHRRRGGYQKREQGPVYRANEAILVPEVRVIDEENKFLGVMPTSEALTTARERGYDLVEVSPKEVPPVCKLIDFGQFKYQKEKEMRVQKARAKKVDVKGIRLSVKMSQHDIDTRQNQAVEFLADGDKLKIEMMLRGREKEHGDLATKRIQAFLAQLEKTYPLIVEQPIARNGGNVSTIVGRKS